LSLIGTNAEVLTLFTMGLIFQIEYYPDDPFSIRKKSWMGDP